MVASQARFALSAVPEFVPAMTLAFVAAATPDLCALQRTGGLVAGPLPDGTIETQDSDLNWYPCTYHSFDGFLQQIYFDRTQPIDDFAPGTPWRINPALLDATPSSGTMV